MKEPKVSFDWIRLIISLVLGAVVTAILMLFRIEWWYYSPYKTLRIIAIPVLWLCFSFIFWRMSPKDGEPL